jgi:hypothetical protein
MWLWGNQKAPVIDPPRWYKYNTATDEDIDLTPNWVVEEKIRTREEPKMENTTQECEHAEEVKQLRKVVSELWDRVSDLEYSHKKNLFIELRDDIDRVKDKKLRDSIRRKYGELEFESLYKSFDDRKNPLDDEA